MTSTQDNTQKMSEEMQHIIDRAGVLVDATSGELDDRIKSARDALKERLDSTGSYRGPWHLERHGRYGLKS